MLEKRSALRGKERKAAKKLYLQAFPREERVPFFILAHKARTGAGEFSALYDRGEFVGITYNIFCRDMVYLFYLAVVPEKRNGGYGGKILEELKESCPGKRILLSVEEVTPEAADYELRKRRRGFYQRHGFQEAHVKFREFGVVFEMLYWGGPFAAEEYGELIAAFRGERLFQRFYQRVE